MTNRIRWRPEGRRDPTGCLWIIGDPREDDSHFCQQPRTRAAEGSVYCAAHEAKSRARDLPKANNDR